MAKVILGCIADDFTGATDLANNLVRGGMRVVQTIGVPAHEQHIDADAVIVALKSRTAPRSDAIAMSLGAMRWLRAQGAEQIYFKYCSTFDSTREGNIGPVAEALMQALQGVEGADFTIATPAFPDNKRTVFKGHLFVGDVLLNESGMENHPLTPMTDANLVRVLQAQCRGKVGLIDYSEVAQGANVVRRCIDRLRAEGARIAIVDAIANDDLLKLGSALKGMPLVTGGSGVAIGLPANFGISPSSAASALPGASGLRAIVSGSCSAATNRQVRAFIDGGGAAFRVDASQIAAGVDVTGQALQWAQTAVEHAPVLVYSTAEPERVKSVQERLGVQHVGDLIERTLAEIARGLVELGVRQLIVAGGETSGACVQNLNVTQLRIGPQIDPGVPWCFAESHDTPSVALHLALKSGNFGTDDFFSKAFAMLA
jgi:uncharacterized protein YgbK (DUF1537 family)